MGPDILSNDVETGGHGIASLIQINKINKYADMIDRRRKYKPTSQSLMHDWHPLLDTSTKNNPD